MAKRRLSFKAWCRWCRKVLGSWVIALGYRLGGIDQTHVGYTLEEVCDRALSTGCYEDLEWLQMWWNSIEENSENHHNFILWMSERSN